MDANYVGAITDLLKWGISAGLSAAEARKTLKANGIDEAEYAAVIDDKRTFKDFHGTNPQGGTVPAETASAETSSGALIEKKVLGTWYPNPILSDGELKALFTRGLKKKSTDGQWWLVIGLGQADVATDPNDEPAIDDGAF